MSKNVRRFPMNSWQRTANRRGKRSASCIVSDRWLKFSPALGQAAEGTAVNVDVMNDINGKQQKICQMVLTLEQLRDVLKTYE